MNTLLQQAQAAGKANLLKDQTEDNGGNFEYEAPAAGPTMARLVSYIEIGLQPQRPFKGKAKPPSPECIIEIQLIGKKHAKVVETTVEGKTVEKTVYPIIRLGRSPSSKVGEAVGNGMNMPGGSKSNHYKLLSAMDYGRGNTNMAFMLGEPFKVEVIHNVVEKEENGKKTSTTFANLRDDNGVWQINAPLIQRFDEETGDPDGPPVPIKVPEATVPLRMLLWDAPSIEQWNSIFIDGTFTRKQGDTEVEVSKNWIQAHCLAAQDFEGSALHTMLMSEGGELPDMSGVPEDVLDEGDDGSELPEDDLEIDLDADVPDEGGKAADDEKSDPLAGIEDL